MSYSSLPFASKLFKLTSLTCALALAGCGGGDGTDTIAPEPDTGVTQPGNGNDGGNGPVTPVDAIQVTPISLTDVNGDVTRIITSSGANASVVVKDETGVPVSGALVAFVGEAVTFGTDNGKVLTNEDGEANISVKPLDSTTTGSYTLNATVSYNNLTATTPNYSFSLKPIDVILADFALSSTSLNSGGTANITLKTKDSSNNMDQNDVTVNFSTSCGTFDNNSMISSNQGDVIATYTAVDANGNLCAGTQTITATPTNNPENGQTRTISIANVEASSIFYTTTDPVQLGASNSGSSSSGQIVFTVYANGRPAANQQVEISKVSAPRDFRFVTLNNQASQTVTSDSQGNVVVNLYPGALPGPVEIKAALISNPNVFALSKDVSVATGRATQNGVSISLSKNVLAVSADGDTATITARLVDRVGNPVPNGTTVSFVSEGGRVTPNCATQSGVCSVEFSTQNPRPVDNRISVVAYVEGDKDYIDRDGDNQFSAGDVFTRNIGDFFRDDNENNQYDSEAGEFVYRRDASGAACAPSTFSQPNILGTCGNGLATILRYQFVLGLAADTPLLAGLPLTLTPNPINNLDTPRTISFQMFGNSAQTVSMASGTTIGIAAEGGSCEAEFTSGNLTVPSVVDLSNQTVNASNVSYRFSYTGCQRNDKIKITVTTPAPSATTTTRTLLVQ
ncbi:hypothetical protein AAJP47_02590 [Psychrobacter sp. B38]|uniref:hypothetical protein n=1 Tax=Psychrobacter sp. B38 TaxID=3143538 RepID=UPI00320C9605